MSSFDKTVKLACKPKAAPPKSKYLDPIIAATWADEGAVSDVCKALAPRFREPNAIIVFKALIVLHTMIRNGSADNVLSYLSSSDVLRLRNVSAGNWDGYSAPKNLQHYAIYLDSRIRAYRELKHDAIRVQAENNRDLRNSLSIEEDAQRNKKERNRPKDINNGPQRSKTIMGRKLRSMTVEKGLLRETRIVQKMIDTLAECRFYLDDLEDELTITALRMLVKDILILIQACNEGVINVLEHYFEMSHTDAKQALEIYRHFCKQTESVNEYLGVAKKLQNLLNVPIPNLKHAPVSLAGALQEYLDDPNFEQNRIEYKNAKMASERNVKSPVSKTKSSESESGPKQIPASASTSTEPTVSAEAKSSPQNMQNNMIDFFAAIEEGPSGPQNPSSPFAAGPHNPFSQMAFGNQQIGQFVIQPTGPIFPQQTSVPMQTNPFGIQGLQSPSHQTFSPFLPSQLTGLPQQSTINPQQGPSGSPAFPPTMTSPFVQSPGLPQQANPFQQFQGTGLPQAQPSPGQLSPVVQPRLRPQPAGLLQPQATGANPFRQTMVFPQSVGVTTFDPGLPNEQSSSNPFGSLNSQKGVRLFGQTQSAGPISTFSNSTHPFGQSQSAAPISSFTSTISSSIGQQTNLPARPSSTPLASPGQTSSSTSPPQAQPVQTHQTGSRNPFGPITKTPPPVPKPPTLMELAMGFHNTTLSSSTTGQSHPSSPQSAPVTNTFSFGSSALNPGPTDMSSVASSFSFAKVNGSSGAPSHTTEAPQTSSVTGSTTSSLFSSTMVPQPTGATSLSSSTSQFNTTGLQPVKSHTTGFTGLKPFKPTSSFGAALLESLPPIPDSAPASADNIQSNPASPTVPSSAPVGPLGATSQLANLRALNSQPTGGFGSFSPMGSTLGQGLRPQVTGGGVSNPFRASMMSPTMPSLPSPGRGLGSPPPFANLRVSSTGAHLFGAVANTNTLPQQQNTQPLI